MLFLILHAASFLSNHRTNAHRGFSDRWGTGSRNSNRCTSCSLLLIILRRTERWNCLNWFDRPQTTSKRSRKTGWIHCSNPIWKPRITSFWYDGSLLWLTLQQLKNSVEPGLEAARRLIQRIEMHDYYPFVGRILVTNQENGDDYENLTYDDLINGQLSFRNTRKLIVKIKELLTLKAEEMNIPFDPETLFIDACKMDMGSKVWTYFLCEI